MRWTLEGATGTEGAIPIHLGEFLRARAFTPEQTAKIRAMQPGDALRGASGAVLRRHADGPWIDA